MRLNAKQICEITGGNFLVDPIDAKALATGLTWDSREVGESDVFVALPGDKVDGHAFIAQSLRAGALVVLVSERPDEQVCLLATELGASVIEVSNTAAAIIDLARAWRKMLKGTVIGVTGSCGKTTTKNLLRDVFKVTHSVVSTQGNQNNELGVPKTLLQADPETQIVIVEMGMDRLGEIADHCEYAKPDAGVITNIGVSHIELLGSKENIARTKAELFAALPERTGKAFMNRNDEYALLLGEYAHLTQREVPLFFYDGSLEAALHKKQDEQANSLNEEDGAQALKWGAWASDISLDAQGCPHFVLHVDNEARECSLPLRGAHNVINACAAVSVAASYGMSVDDIVSGLINTVPETGRQEVVHARNGLTVINDTYNASPDSMKAALHVLASYETTGRKVAVLGDMGELGDFAQGCHEGVGEAAAQLPIDRLVCVGELSQYIARAAKDAGFDSAKITAVDSTANALTELESFLAPEDVVLVKASRFMELERIVGGLVN